MTGGEVQFDDRVLDRMHRVSGLQVGVPLISNLDDAAAVPVQPALFAFVNGSPLSLAGTSLPFSENRETSVHAVLKDLEIATYLPM